MKYLILVLAMGLTTPLLAEKPTATAEDYFKQGEAALKAGNIELAQGSYRKALQLDPNHGNAKYRLLSMKDLTADARIRIRKANLEKIVLPQVTFEDLTLEESLEALGVMIEKASDDTYIPNFVIDDPNSTITKNPVNIRLRGIPASVALKYVLSQAKAKVVWDAHVITVRPLAGSAPSTKAPVTTEAKKGSRLE